MYLSDFHVHSSISPDSSVPMMDICSAAISKGCKEIAFTEHFECYTADHKGYPFDREYILAYISQLEECRNAFADHLIIRSGFEIGQPTLDDAKVQLATQTVPLDFIISSVHKLKNVDLAKFDYSVDDPKEIMKKALQLTKETAINSCFDVLGHADLIFRYLARQGVHMSLDPWMDDYAEIFSILIKNGKGIEINTSGKRQEAKRFLPDLPLVKLYRDLGGEILTIGSDSHTERDVCANIVEAALMAQEAGFRYHCTFSDRKAVFHKL